MQWGFITGLFLLSTVKFMFAPLGGPGLGLTFFETYFACVAGGLFGATIFFFSSDYFIKRSKSKNEKLLKKKLDQGIPITKKKVFTKTNKFIVKIKMSIGIIGISFWAPFLLSIPIGSIVAAKFYGDNKKAFPLIILGMFLNGIVTTGIAYLIY